MTLLLLLLLLLLVACLCDAHFGTVDTETPMDAAYKTGALTGPDFSIGKQPPTKKTLRRGLEGGAVFFPRTPAFPAGRAPVFRLTLRRPLYSPHR